MKKNEDRMGKGLWERNYDVCGESIAKPSYGVSAEGNGPAFKIGGGERGGETGREGPKGPWGGKAQPVRANGKRGGGFVWGGLVSLPED